MGYKSVRFARARLRRPPVVASSVLKSLGVLALIVGALLSVALFTPGTGPSQDVLIAEVATYIPPAREDAWQISLGVENVESHVVICRREQRPNSRFTQKVCRKAKDLHRSTMAAQSDLSDALMRTNVNVSGR